MEKKKNLTDEEMARQQGISVAELLAQRLIIQAGYQVMGVAGRRGKPVEIEVKSTNESVEVYVKQ